MDTNNKGGKIDRMVRFAIIYSISMLLYHILIWVFDFDSIWLSRLVGLVVAIVLGLVASVVWAKIAK